MTRQRVLIVSLLLFLLVGGVFAAAHFRAQAKSAPIRAADAFFQEIVSGRLYDAFRTTSSVIRGDNFEKFERSIVDARLDQYASATWRRLPLGTGNEERLQGEIVSREGQTMPFTLSMVREAGRWRVFSVVSEERGSVFRSPGESAEPQPVPTQTPTEQQARALVLDTLLRFNEAVQIRFFGPFYQQISTAWQNQTSPEDLYRAFNAFVENRISFGSMARSEPRFDGAPQISPEGLLTLNGDCPTESYIVRFSMRYLYERGKWRLFGIDLNLLAPGAVPAASGPSAELPSSSPSP